MGGPRLVVTDTSIVLNFLKIGRPDILENHRTYRFVVTEHVRGEVEFPEQEQLLDEALERGRIELVEVTDPEALAIFAELDLVVETGEASCIALAQTRGWMLATDEGGRTRAEVVRRLGAGRLVTTKDVLRQAILDGRLTVEQADELKAEFAKKRFVMPFASFRELL